MSSWMTKSEDRKKLLKINGIKKMKNTMRLGTMEDSSEDFKKKKMKF